MAGRQRSTFQKRQKEVKRLEAQRMKRDKREARKQERALGRTAGPDSDILMPEADSDVLLPGPEASNRD